MEHYLHLISRSLLRRTSKEFNFLVVLIHFKFNLTKNNPFSDFFF